SSAVPTAGLVLSAALAAAAAALAHRQGAGLRRLGDRAIALAGDPGSAGNDPQRDLAAALDRIAAVAETRAAHEAQREAERKATEERA
ncbi:hypothetical protein SB912_29445, partial [Pantoea sp. SIMBA_072]